MVTGPVRIRHSSHDFGWQSSHSVDLAGWQAKMASIEIWIQWCNAHKPHCLNEGILFCDHYKTNVQLWSICLYWSLPLLSIKPHSTQLSEDTNYASRLYLFFAYLIVLWKLVIFLVNEDFCTFAQKLIIVKHPRARPGSNHAAPTCLPKTCFIIISAMPGAKCSLSVF